MAFRLTRSRPHASDSFRLTRSRPHASDSFRLTRSRPYRRLLAALLAAALLPAAAWSQGAVCERPPAASGPVSLIILSSGAKVHELAAAVGRGVAVAAKDSETVVFADGRVITADVEAAGEHLNRLGWGGRGIRVVATLPAQRARPRSAAPG